LEVISTSDPTIVYKLEAYAAPAEVWVTLWQRAARRADLTAVPGADWQARTTAACEQLRRFAKVIRIARPRYWLWRGLAYHLSGQAALARRYLRRGVATARQLEMRYEEALAGMHLGFLLPAADPEGTAATARARGSFSSRSAPATASPVSTPTRGDGH